MSRNRLILALSFALAACSSSKPPSNGAPKGVNEATTPITASEAAASVGTGVVTPPPPPDLREATLAAAITQLLPSQHLLRPKLDDAVSREAFKTYMDRIDAGKMFLLKGDRDSLAGYADKIDDELRDGNLALAHDGAKLFAARVAVVEKVVAALLASPMDFTDAEWVELDNKKVSPAATEDELKDRWRQRLELEVLQRVAAMESRLAAEAKRDAAKAKASKQPAPKPAAAPADPDDDADDDRSAVPLAQIPATPALREAKAREDLSKQYSGRFARLRTPGPLDAAADMINAVTAAIDPHTEYQTPAESANFDIAMSGSLEGIGAVLREKEHYIEVIEIVPGGASSRQGGLDPGDLILSVQQDNAEPVDTFDRRIDEVVKMIRGKKGTIVKLRIQKQTGQESTLAITRDVVVVEDTYARGAVLERKGKPSYGYIHLPGFYGRRAGGKRAAGADVAALLRELGKKKVAGVILDMRSNGGGLLDEAVQLTGAVIDTGPVVQVNDSENERVVLRDDQPGTSYDGPLLVLVDRFSASAAEIVAGALQDYHRAVVVGAGAQTHGKGTVQTLIDLDRLTGGRVELGELKLTIQQFFRVTGASTQRAGVVPDVVLPDPAGHIESGERTLEHAIAWSQIDAEPFTRSAAKWQAADLAKKSAARVAKQPLLAKIAVTTELLKARQADTRVPLQRTAWEQRRKEQEAALEAASPNLDKAAPAFTVTVVVDPNAPAAGPQEPPAVKPTGKPTGTPGAGKPALPADRATRWRDTLARDPWVAECLNILADAQ